jgi:hypothetical protein
MDGELRQGNVEGVVRGRQLLRGRPLHAGVGMALASGRDERLGGIDRRHGRRPNPPD